MKNQTKWGIAAIVVLIIGEIMIFSFQKGTDIGRTNAT